MTLSTLTSRVSYPGAGSTGPFAFPFRILADADLLVTKRSSTGTETTLTLTTHYTVLGALEATGSVTLVTALAVGETLTLRRKPPLTQPTSIRNQGEYFASTHEDVFDRLEMQLQALQDSIDRSVKLKESLTGGASLTELEPTAGKVVTGTGTGFTMTTLDSSAVSLPGSGRTVATLSAYLANNAVFNVKDFGAVGDNVADDTAKFQSAIDAGVSVFVPAPSVKYKLTDSLTLHSNLTIYAEPGTAELLQTAAKDVFVGTGTQNAHLTNIAIRGLKLTGQQATVSKFGINIQWVDKLTFTANVMSDLKIAYVSEALVGETYAQVDITKLQKEIVICRNRSTIASATNEDQNAHIFLRYARSFEINENVILGKTANAGGSGIEVFGGGVNPATDGALANGRKCYSGVINGNTITNQVAGIQIAQCRAVTGTGNSLDQTGESLWIGGSFECSLNANTVTSDNASLQFQGINRNCAYADNVVYTTSSTRALFIGDAWTSTSNAGPISFINNTVYSTLANTAAFYDCGHLIVRGNKLYNVSLQFLGSTQFLEVEDNTLVFDLFTAATACIRLSGYNANMPNMGTKTFTSIKRNKLVNRSGADMPAGFIYAYDPATTSRLEIVDNTFDGTASDYAFVLNTTSGAIALTTIWKRNRNAGRFNTKSNNTATTSRFYFSEDNEGIDGKPYFTGVGAFDITIHYFSVGSRIQRSPVVAAAYIGDVCVTEGASGTWKAYGATVA